MFKENSGVPVQQYLNKDGDSVYYENAFLRVIEEHIPYLRKQETVQVLSIADSTANAYDHDLYGVLTSSSIPVIYHWVIMRLNNLTSPFEYRAEMVSLLLPDFNEIEKIKTRYQSTQSIR